MARMRQCIARLGGHSLLFYVFLFLLRAGKVGFEQLQANDLVGIRFL